MNRREMLANSAALLFAPAIVRATSLMPVSVQWTRDIEDILLTNAGGRWLYFDYAGSGALQILDKNNANKIIAIGRRISDSQPIWEWRLS